MLLKNSVYFDIMTRTIWNNKTPTWTWFEESAKMRRTAASRSHGAFRTRFQSRPCQHCPLVPLLRSTGKKGQK